MNRWNSVAVLVALASLLALPAAVQALPIADTLVSPAEMAGMQLLYAVNDGQFDFNDAYTTNNSGSIPAGSFSRVGYYVQLGSNWVWASMDTFNANPSMLGVPKAGTGIVQNGTLVNNLHVETNTGSPVTPGTYANGIIEFWASDYGSNGGGLYGSNDSLFDWKDSGGSTNGGHGSFQVFSLNPALTSGKTLFGVTANGGSGIGDQPTGNPDWTFGPGTGSYAVRNLEIWVGSPAPATTLTWNNSDTGNWSAANWNPGPVAGPNDPTTKGIVAGGNVTVNGNFTAYSLQLDGGQVTMGPNNTLTLARGIQSSGGTLALTNGSRVITDLAGGTLNALTVSGTATLEARTGTLTVANTTVSSTLVKAGAGTVQLQSVTALPTSVFEVAGGTLKAQTPNFLGGAGNLVLSGGTFEVTGAGTSVNNALRGSIFFSTLTPGPWGPSGNVMPGDQTPMNLDGATYQQSLVRVLTGDKAGTILTMPEAPALNVAVTGSAQGWTAWSGLFDGNTEQFVTAFSGKFVPTESGSYNFRWSNDDAGLMYIDMDHNGKFDASERVADYGWNGSGNKTLSAATPYSFIYMAREYTGGQSNNWWFTPPSGGERAVDPSAANQAGQWQYGQLGPIDMSATAVSVTAGTTGSRLVANTDIGATFASLSMGAGAGLTMSGLISFPGGITTNGNASLGLSGSIVTNAYNDQGIPSKMRLYGGGTLSLEAATIADVNAKATNFQVETGTTFRVAGAGLLGGAPLVTIAGGTFTIAPVPAGSDAMMQLTDVSVIASSTINGAATGQVALGKLDFSAPGILTTGGTTSALSFLDTTIKAGGTCGFSTGVRTFTGALDGGGFTTTLAKQGASDLIVSQGGTNLGGTTLEAQAGRLVVDGPGSVAGAKLNIAGGQIVLTSPTGSNQTYNNTITSTANGILTAGTGGVGVASGDISVTSLTPALGTTVELRSEGAQALILPNGVTAPGSINVTQGNVQIRTGANLANLMVNGGRATLTGNAALTQGLYGSGGTLATQGNISITPTRDLSFTGTLEVRGGDNLTINVPAISTPGSLPGLQAWYDASTLPYTNGQTVATWKDLSPNSRTANNPAGTVTYATSQIGGLPAVHFVGGSLQINSAMQVKEEYMVFRSGNGATFGPDWGSVIGAQDGNGWMLQGGTTQFWTDGNHLPQAVAQNGTALPGSPYALSNVGNYMVMKVDLSVNDSSAARTGYLGRNGGWGNSNLDIAEVLAFDHALTTAEQGALGKYLGTKYSILTSYAGDLSSKLGDIRLGDGAQLTLNGVPTAGIGVNSVGATSAGPIATGAMQLTNIGAPVAGRTGSTVAIDATISTASFNVTGPGTIALTKDLTVTGSLKIANTATVSARNSLTINASTAGMDVKGRLDITGAPGTTLTFALPAPGGAMPGSLQAWYDASTLNLANGAAVTTWNDASGNGHTATRTAGTLTFATNQINGMPVVQFADNTYANATGNMYSKEQYVVVKVDSGDWGAFLGSGVRSGYMLNQNGNFWDQNYPVAVKKNGTVLPNPPYALGDDQPYMLLKITGNDVNTTLRTYSLGRSEGWNRLVMNLAEVLAFNTTLSAADENNVGGYLAKKYGISAPSYTGSVGVPNLGNLTMAPGTNLTLTGGATAAFSSIRTGAGATITGNVIANGPVAPGSSPGTLNIIGNYTQAAGSSYEWETVGNGAGQSDLIAVTGNLTASANWTLSINPLAGVSSGMYNLFTYGGGLTGGPAWGNVTLTKTGAYADLVNLAGSSIDSTLAGAVRLNLAMYASSNWTSAGDINWNVAGNWNSGAGPVPTAAIAAIVNTNTATATVTPGMGAQAALSLVVDNGRALVQAGGVLNVANSANVTAIGQLTVNGTLSATALNTAGTTAFGPAATLTTPLINVTGGTTTGNGTTLASATTLRLAGGTLAGSFTATNPSTTAGTYAYEVQAGISNASLGGALASLRKSTAGAAILNGSVNLNRMDVAVGSLAMRGGTVNSLDVAAGSSLTLNDSLFATNRLTGAGTVTTNGTLSITAQQALSLSGTLNVASGNLLINVPASSSPTTLPGLQAWYNAGNTGFSYSNGQTVATWNDLSGNGRTATYYAGTANYASTDANGLPAVQFRGGSLSIPSPMFAKEMYYVFRSGNGTNFGPDWGSVLGPQSDWSNSAYLFRAGNANFWEGSGLVGVSRNGNVVSSADNFQMGVGTVGNYMVLKIDVNNNHTDPRAYFLGRNEGFSNSNLDVAEVLAFNTTLSAADESKLGHYLGTKYGISTTYTGLLGPSLGDVRLAGGTSLTLSGVPPTGISVKSIGAIGGPIATGAIAMQLTNLGAPAASANPAGTTVAIDATINATNFNVTGPGAVTLKQNLAVTGFLKVADNATLSAQNSLTINASNAGVNVKGGLDVAGAPGTTLTFATPAVSTATMPGLGTSLQAWYDASTLSLADGATVTTWNDLSGNGRTATYNNGTVTYAPTDANGQPAVHFISGILNINSAMLATEQYFVFRSGNGAVFGPDWGAVLGRQDGNSWMFQGNTTNTWDQHRPQAIVENGVSMPTAGPLTNVGQYMVLKIDTNADNNAAATYYLGRNGGWGNNNLDIAEVLAFNVPLSAADENNLGGYLAKKYGISAPGYTGSIGIPNLGHLTMAPGTNLTLTGVATAAFESITTGNGATITGNVINLGPVAPGSGPGTLNILGDLIMDDGSTYLWELGASAEDRIVLTGDLELNDWTLRIIDAGGDSYAWEKHYIFTGFTSLSGPNNVTFDLSQAPLWAQFTTNLELGIDGGGLYLVGLNSMPEPTSLTLLALGGLALWRRRRRAS